MRENLSKSDLETEMDVKDVMKNHVSPQKPIRSPKSDKKVVKKKNERTVFVVSYNPALPSISSILQRHWRVMTKDPYLKQVFPSPPMVAFRRAKNLKDKLVKANQH